MNDQNITQEKVEVRIADWLKRVRVLYSTIKDWLQTSLDHWCEWAS